MFHVGNLAHPARACSSAWLERIPDKDEVPGSNPGRPTPENPVPVGVFTISHPSEAPFWGDRGQTRGQTCQASAKRMATSQPLADTSRSGDTRPVRMGFHDRYTSAPKSADVIGST